MKYIWQHKNWPKFTWNSEALLPLVSQARIAQGKLLAKVAGLGFQLGREARVEILIEEAVKTAAIEGERLNRESVRSSVAKQLGLPITGLPSAGRPTDGLVKLLLEATQGYEKPLAAATLKHWQALLFPTGYSGLKHIQAGEWRGSEPMQVVSGKVGKEKIHYEAPSRDRLEEEMKQFLSWWNKSLSTEEGILRAGLAHFYFVTIHPFEDGNGRIARALTEKALAQDEKLSTRYYSLSSQIMEDRNNYYDVLEECQKGNLDVTRWLKWFLECFIRSVEGSEKLIANVLTKATFWQRHDQMLLSERQRKVVNKLLDAGKGNFQGGLTTRKYVSLTKASRATAFREISDLVNKKILVQNAAKGGRSVSYELNWEKL